MILQYLFQPDSFDKLNALNSRKLHDSKKLLVIRNGTLLTKEVRCIWDLTESQLKSMAFVPLTSAWFGLNPQVVFQVSILSENLSMCFSDLAFLKTDVFKYVLK